MCRNRSWNMSKKLRVQHKGVFMKTAKKFNALTDHKPGKGLGEWIGVEIECFMPYASLEADGWSDACEKLAEMIKAAQIPYVTVKTDGSISSRDDNKYFETEITILFKRTNKTPLKKLCLLLKKLKVEVNKTCGLHVHLDCRDICNEKLQWNEKLPNEVRLRGQKLENVLPLLLKMVSRSRRNNTYCAPRMSENRSAINLGAFHRHNTIEVRLHQGSANYEKISQWIELLYRASRSRKNMSVDNIEKLKQYLSRAPKSLTEYVNSRIESLDEEKRKAALAAKKQAETESKALAQKMAEDAPGEAA